MHRFLKIISVLAICTGIAYAGVENHLSRMDLGGVDIASILMIGFMISLGHCIGMCGGIVMAYSTSKIDPTWSKISQSKAHMLYSLGRVTTYAVMGAIFGAIGSAVTFSNMSIGIMTIIAGIVMILAGLSVSGKVKFLTLIEHSLSSSPTYARLFHKALSSKSGLSFYLLGMLNGLLPCGPVYIFAIAAAATASPVLGAIVMAIFGLSTIPAMFAVGMFSGAMSGFKFKKIMLVLASVSIVLYGFWTIKRGYGFIANPNMSPKSMATKAYQKAQNTSKSTNKAKEK